MPRAAATIRDVARDAGVSPSTVSRALSRPDLVNAATVERVRAASRALGYLPSPQARYLLTGRSHLLTLVLPDVTNPFFFDIIRGAQHEANRSGFVQILVDAEETADNERAHIAAARKSTDGVLLGGSRLTDSQLQELSQDFPVVLINRQVPDVPSVVVDTPPSLAAAVAHLVELGHRDIGYLGGPLSAWFEPRRYRAVRAAARRLGVRARRLGNHAPTRAAGEKAAATVAESGVTALLTYNDLQALGVLRGLRDLGLVVPRDISLVGCDDIFGVDLTNPALTTVTAPAEAAGHLATRTLVQRLTMSPESGRIREVLPTVLTVRDSTGPVRRR